LASDAFGSESPTLATYVRVLRAGKWIILLTTLALTAAAVAVSGRQQPLYRASGEVLLKQQGLASSLTGIQDPNTGLDPQQFLETQVDIARVPAIAERVKKAAGIRVPFLASSEAKVKGDSSILELAVTDRERDRAARLANEYARQYVAYRRELDTEAIFRARRDVQQQLRQLRAQGAADSPVYASLVTQVRQLRTLQALQTSNAVVIKLARAGVARQVQPRWLRNVALGLAFGLVAGVLLAFGRDALDTRVRSADEISETLALPLLARLSLPPRRLRRRDQLVMRERPAGPHAEAYRMLRTNLEFATLEREVRSVMVTSAVEEEGKSTTAANLAVALALGGRRVTLVDLDLRRASLDNLFQLNGGPGFTDVALGHATIDDASTWIELATGAQGADGAARNGDRPVTGTLRVVSAGPLPPNAGEFVRTTTVSAILDLLVASSDIVILDAPPLLHVGDAMTLSTKVEAMLLVTRLGVVRRPMLHELRRLLGSMPTLKLGFVLTAAKLDETYGSGYYVMRYETREADRFAGSR
jgi:tyrosine-protein kinase